MMAVLLVAAQQRKDEAGDTGRRGRAIDSYWLNQAAQQVSSQANKNTMPPQKNNSAQQHPNKK